MRQDGIEACLLQDTWQVGENFDEEVNVFHIFNTNYDI